jgi:hypothetical protein
MSYGCGKFLSKPSFHSVLQGFRFLLPSIDVNWILLDDDTHRDLFSILIDD